MLLKEQLFLSKSLVWEAGCKRVHFWNVAAVTKQQLSPCSAASSTSEFGAERAGAKPRSYTPQCWKWPQGSSCRWQSGEQAHPAVCGAEDPLQGVATVQPLLQKQTGALKVMRMENRLMHFTWQSDGGIGRRGKSEINPVTATEEL